ncbi:sugar ABC transporter substrate-binding protein [Kaistia geumhonensis]|uniref:Multiple sugar transport system substrate-binding protein n=1 Tax=Kaistia geumhonensis TaxID=410839 RepID=A0ABU0M8I5_9HYPH|nr:multiple monosaccharide ABC transporter substrate-binding protein [Kaistia geumhonensis]MCX5477509.1 sugar ABC transporter substrate-binding protein [Kaistia geumhonensis]MDQ0517284.1 putative multiple sugar transport system substrate-binding protein [Kaistia geumhonensis]
MKLIKSALAALALGVVALSPVAHAEDKGLIGVLMPTKTSQRWINDGDAVKSQLEAKGYTVDLQYAQDDIPNQLSQLENVITKGPKALIIASIDGTTMGDALQKAADAGVVVVAYDRLIKKTPNVDYYTTFDNFGVGVIQANSLVKGLKERFPDTKPWNVELFGGSPDDNNAFFFYNGAMSVLQPLIDDGSIKIVSGQTGMDKVGTLRWLAATAQARMDNLLSAYYSDGKRVDGVLSPYDGLSRGIIASLRGVGYGTADQPWPIVTGQDAETASVKAIIAGEQYSTVFKDTRDLAKSTVELVDTVLSGNTPANLDTTTYNNDVKVVPSILLTPVEVDKTNYEKIVVESGYIKPDELK